MVLVMQELPLVCLMLLLLCRDPGKWGLHSPIMIPMHSAGLAVLPSAHGYPGISS